MKKRSGLLWAILCALALVFFAVPTMGADEAPNLSLPLVKYNSVATSGFAVTAPVSTTGLWHLETMDVKQSSGTVSAQVYYYGQNYPPGNYNTGSKNTGDMVFNFDLSNNTSPVLTFDTKWGTEGGSYYDACEVLVGADKVWNRGTAASSDWTSLTVDLSAYAGDSSVDVTFRFDTKDSIANSYFGWAVYNVQVLGGGGSSTTGGVSISQLEYPKFPTIDVYVNVSDSQGMPVSGLTVNDFAVTEDGASVKDLTVTSLGSVAQPLSLALVADRSGSMSSEMNNAKQALTDFVSLSTGAQDQFALISFATSVTVDQTFTTDKDVIKNKIANLSASGMTNLYKAIYDAVTETALQAGVKAVVAFTDGNDTEYGKTVDQVIAHAKDKKIPVYTIGLGFVDEAVLKKIATQTGGFYKAAKTGADLQSVYNALLNIINNQYKVSYTTPNPNLDGTERCAEVTVTLPDGTTGSATACYYADMPPQISLNSATDSAVKNGAPYSDPLTIGAIVTADQNKGKTVQEVSLFYRPFGSADSVTFTKVQMQLVSGDDYEAILKDADYEDPGVEFYITASDGTLNTTSPSKDLYSICATACGGPPPNVEQIYILSPKDNAALSYSGAISFSFTALSKATKYILYIGLTDIIQNSGIIPLSVELIPATTGPWGSAGTPGFSIGLGIGTYVISLDQTTWDALGAWDIVWGVEAYDSSNELIGSTFKSGAASKYVNGVKLMPSTAVTLTSPSNGTEFDQSKDSAPTFKWELYSGASAYSIILAHVGSVGFDNVMSDTAALNVYAMGSAAWATMPIGQWYWTVLAYDASGNMVAPQYVIFGFEVF